MGIPANEGYPEPPKIQTPEQMGDEDASKARLGMWIFLGSLTMLFGASLLAYFLARYGTEKWQGVNMSGLPAGMWLSTVVMVASSATMHWAILAIRRDDQAAFFKGLLSTSLLAVIFLTCQFVNWRELVMTEMPADTKSLYVLTFYMLAALHALHVLGGVIPLFVVTVKAKQKKYYSFFHPGPQLVAMYWHFLDVVWLIMFVVMFVVS